MNRLLTQIYAQPPKQQIPALPHELSDACARLGLRGAAEEYEVSEQTVARWLRDTSPPDGQNHVGLTGDDWTAYVEGVYDPSDEYLKWEVATDMYFAIKRGEASSWAALFRMFEDSGVPLYKSGTIEYLRSVAWLLDPPPSTFTDAAS